MKTCPLQQINRSKLAEKYFRKEKEVREFKKKKVVILEMRGFWHLK